ncbi:MAG: MarR family transcriptional regulator [Cyclobacteriaceae bacterium]|nr:MarR family transcriptional regulator [Cyclobacteriaceae bacterium]
MEENLHFEIGYLIRQASRIGGYRMDHKFERAGYPITREQFGVIRLLWEENGRTQQNLAERLVKNKASITSLIENLEKKNLILRKPNRHDKRSKLVYLTEKGRMMHDNMLELVQEIVDVAVKGIEDEKLMIVRDVLRKMIENITSEEL